MEEINLEEFESESFDMEAFESESFDMEAFESESFDMEAYESDEPKREKKTIEYRPSILQCFALQLIVPLTLLWDELIFHAYVNGGFSSATLPYLILFPLAIGSVVAVITGRLGRIATIVINWIVIGAAVIWFVAQGVYHNMVQVYLTLSITTNAEEAAEFKSETFDAVIRTLPLILLLLVPVAAYILLTVFKVIRHAKVEWRLVILPVLVAAECFVFASFLLMGEESVETGRYDLFFKDWENDRGVTDMGVSISFFKDLKQLITYDPEDVGDIDPVSASALKPIVVVKEATPSPTLSPTPAPTRAPADTPTPTPTPTPSPTPVDRSPHVLDIDFAALAENESNQALKTIHEYFAAAEPTNKNEYTGLCKDFNLIMLTCETFTPYAVDENLTPTLYKLVNNGFVFNNFYTPRWITSTSDGEYVACTGLLPDLQKSNSFSRSANNSMPLCFGHIFKGMGYSARAFHDHDYKYYDRDKSHPNMGYEWIAQGNGLELTKQFPESDVEMMEATIPMYINDEHFCAYYMTVSGHMVYNWNDNAMSRKNREFVEDLPYSEACKCYLAANIELDRAMEYLLSELEKAGKLENTLIVMSGDHYAYGLKKEEISELLGHKVETEFELYKNHCVIWSGAFKENVVVDKYCCSLDIMPTVLNLLGIEYDSRLYMGTDMLSNMPALVQFKSGSFITDFMRYNATTGKSEWFVEVNLNDEEKKEYVNVWKSITKTKLNISRAILNNDYYKTIVDQLWWMKE